MKFAFKNVHHCDAIVMMCMDFRFWEATADYLKREKGIKTFDFLSFPGAAKMIIENQGNCPAEVGSKISCSLHNSSKIVVVNHADCGAYGGRKAFSSIEEERQKHLSDLAKAMEQMKKCYPDKEVVGVYVDLDEEMEELSFIDVTAPAVGQ